MEDFLDLVEEEQEGSVKLCIKCGLPVYIYGRLNCSHVFCLACATEMTTCYICGADTRFIRKFAPQDIIISPITLQGHDKKNPAEQATMQQNLQRLQKRLSKLDKPT